MVLRKILIALLIALGSAGIAPAQEYDVPDVRVSKDRVKVDGKSFYAHVVTPRQTLFSISKAYEVSIDAIYEANKNLNLKEEGLKVGQVLLIPVAANSAVAETRPAENADTSSSSVTAADTTRRTGSFLDRWLFPGKARQRDTSAFEIDIPARIKIAVMLPFQGSRMSDNAVDFYSGALLAARDLGNSGIALDINAVDIRDSASISPFVLSAYDVIIGPVTSRDMTSVLRKCPEGKYVISPLDPQSAGLTAIFPSIQAPTPVTTQNKEVVLWALEDMAPADSLVLLTARGGKLSESSASLVAALKESGRKFYNISYDIHDGASIQRTFAAHASNNGTTRYIIASDEESFVSDAIRNINLMVFKKYDVALYAPSRLRSYSYIETGNLHAINTHICTAYFTDYDQKPVSNFILAYRALYNAEPNSFAFHGYDTMHYFANICRIYGRQWPKKLEQYRESGLQTNFSFRRDDDAEGFVNTAVRRVVYTPDFRLEMR